MLKIKSFSPLPRQFSSLSWRLFYSFEPAKGKFLPGLRPLVCRLRGTSSGNNQ
nr:MAG TPA: hypothetical protein [Caudoviricetes sp.]